MKIVRFLIIAIILGIPQVDALAQAPLPPAHWIVTEYSEDYILFTDLLSENRTTEMLFNGSDHTAIRRFFEIECDEELSYRYDDLVLVRQSDIIRIHVQDRSLSLLDPEWRSAVMEVGELDNRFAFRCGNGGAPGWMSFSEASHALRFAHLLYSPLPEPGQGWARLDYGEGGAIYVPKIEAGQGSSAFFVPNDGATGGTFGLWGANCSTGRVAILATVDLADLAAYSELLGQPSAYSNISPMAAFAPEERSPWVSAAAQFLCTDARETLDSADFGLAELIGAVEQ